MKRTKYIYPSHLGQLNSLFALLALFVLFFTTGCEQYSTEVAQDKPSVNLSLNIFLGLQATSDDGTQQERKVTSLRVYAFHANGYLDKMTYDPINGLTSEPYVKEMTVFPGKKTFCLVANEPSRLSASLANIKNIWDLQALTLEKSDITFSSSEQVLLPMTSITSVTITAGQAETVNLSLKRAVAKVELKFIKETTNSDVVKLESVQIRNTPDKSRLMENNLLNVSSSLVDLTTQNYASALLSSTLSEAVATDPIYLFEHHTGAGDPNNLNSTVLRVVLNIKGTNMTYTIPLRITSGEQKHYNVLRNNYYCLLVTVGDGTLQVGYDIVGWNEKSPWDKELGEKNSKSIKNKIVIQHTL